MLPGDSAVCWRLGSSSTSTSVITTSAPMPARVSASWRPRPRDAPVTIATLPVRSNIPSRPQLDGAALAGDGARDDKPLDFRCALPDLIDLRVPKPLLDGVSGSPIFRLQRSPTPI